MQKVGVCECDKNLWALINEICVAEVETKAAAAATTFPALNVFFYR